MKDITYITGNQKKADYLASYLGHPITHQKIDLDEIQSLDLQKIIKHKVKQAHAIIRTPVVVEDTSLEFKALGGLPGPFIKYFLERMSLEDICSLLDGKDRRATAKCTFGYFDGEKEKYFEGYINGAISEKPKGDRGFGFNPIFIPEGFAATMSELDERDFKAVYTTIKPINQLKEYLENLDALSTGLK